MADTWLILPYENLFGKLQDKESNRKYYFTGLAVSDEA